MTCTWFFQLLNTEYIQFNITKFSFKKSQRKEATLSFFQGAAGTGPPLPTHKSNMTRTPIFITYARGPFITMILDTKAPSRGELTITYGPTSRGKLFDCKTSIQRLHITQLFFAEAEEKRWHQGQWIIFLKQRDIEEDFHLLFLAVPFLFT